MSGKEGPNSIRVGTVGEQRFAKFLLTQAHGIPEAMMRFIAGSPTTEQERFHRNVAEARHAQANPWHVLSASESEALRSLGPYFYCSIHVHLSGFGRSPSA